MIRVFMLVMLLVAIPVAAQTPTRDVEAQRTAMAALSPLRGLWLGQGERILPSGERYRFTQTMRVEPRATGLILTIEGQSLRHGASDTKPGGGSFAVVTFDDRSKAYVLRSFGFGEMVEAKAELLAADRFRWTVAAGPAQLRFTIDLSVPGQWRELGERSLDAGKTWSPTNTLVAHRTETR
jgi:hypothetical protein